MTRETEHYSIEIPSRLNQLAKVEKYAEEIFIKAGISEENLDNMSIVFTEVVNNAIIHGNKKDKSKKVYIDFVVSPDEIEIRVRDEGNGFDPRKIADPVAPENLMKESGRGIFILRALMDSVDFEFKPEGTITIMKKRLPI